MSNTKTICLNMIIKNEGKQRMCRLLDSISKIIDEVVISDTGSSDDTIQSVKDKCTELKVPCFIDETPFKDFGFSRSRGIDVAVQNSKCDYLLFLDADMRLVITDKFNKQDILSKDMDTFSLMQKSGSLEYYNVRLAKRTFPGLKCIGVTHEHYGGDGHFRNMNIPPEYLFIDDIGDGGCKSDKFSRDYRLLTQGLVDEPGNIRYMFYLAETCRHDRRFDESIKYYKMRVKAGGWEEEVYRALMGICLCYFDMGKPDKGDKYAMMAYMHRPTRVETLYTACKWHREKGENQKAYNFYQLGHRVARPPGDVLFVETAPYQWGWKFEYAILAFYVEKPPGSIYKNPAGLATALRNIVSSLGPATSKDNDMPGFAYDNILENCKHYIEALPSAFPRKDMDTIILKDYTSSTPGLIKFTGKKYLTRFVRHVNYKIRRENGSYVLPADGSVRSECVVQKKPGAQWKQLTFNYTGIKEGPSRSIKDIEDLRLFNLAPDVGFIPSTMIRGGGAGDRSSDECRKKIKDSKRVYGIGTSAQWSKDGNLTMILVEVDKKNSIAYPIKRIPRALDCEKNHAPISGTNYCVHSWGPSLKIYDIHKTTKYDIHWAFETPACDVPAWFRDLRGSSCGIAFPSEGTPAEYWFICHRVYHETPRRYTHCLVRLDATTFAPVGFTIPFQFDEFKIEFVGGIAFEENDRTLVVGYSVFDSSSREVRIPIIWLLREMMLSISSPSNAPRLASPATTTKDEEGKTK